MAHDSEVEQRLGPYDLLGVGVGVAVRTFEPLATALRWALGDLPTCRRTTRNLVAERYTDGSWSVAWPDEQRYDGPLVDHAFYDVLCAFNDIAARQVARDGAVGLHGGAVTIDGRAVALLGPSGSGKSTLTAYLVGNGCPFIADEVVAVDADHHVRPFHRPIGLRAASFPLLGLPSSEGPFLFSHPVVASELGDLAGAAPLGLIAFVERSPDHPPTALPLSRAETLHRLCNLTLGTQDLERDVFRRLESVARSVPAIVLVYHDLPDGARLVRESARHDGAA